MAEINSQPQRKRARQACLACNSRRVKCNVVEERPCANCKAANVPCETRESRRGKHPRPSKRRRSEVQSVGSIIGDGKQNSDEVAAGHVLASLHKNTPLGPYGVSDGNGELTRVSTVQSAGPRLEDDSDVFLGESSSLRYVHEEPTSASNSGPTPTEGVGRFRHSVPSSGRAEALVPQWEMQRRRARIALLEADGAFSLPEPASVVQSLIGAYFRWFHPCFAVVDEEDIWAQYHSGTLSPLLLQAMLFIGVLHCEEATIHQLGMGNRHRVKYIFYNRAKDIYDVELETKKLTIIQALFLLSFWRAGALLEKDARHWLGAAITLAQTKALHRAAGKADTPILRLQKRLWWAIYTRDRQCAAALGLPDRIRDEDCDIEGLEPSDYAGAFSQLLPRQRAEDYVMYAVGMAELAGLLGRICHYLYSPRRNVSGTYRHTLREELFRWKQRLPHQMQCDTEEPAGEHGFHASMQQLAYNNLLVLLYRSDFIGSEADSREADGAIALSAAARNSRIIEDLLADGNLRHGQIHVITNLFNTLCVHTVHLRRSEGTTKTVAEHRAKLCLLGLKELQKTWEVTNWVLQLFFSYLDRTTAERLRVQQDEESAVNTAQVSRQVSPARDTKSISSEIFDRTTGGIGGGEVGANQPMLNYNPSPDTLPSMTSMVAPGATPWSWTSEEANQYLFQQIESDFPFGEGGMLDWAVHSNDIFHGQQQGGQPQGNGSLFQPDVTDAGISI